MLFSVVQMRFDSHGLLLLFTFSHIKTRDSILNWAGFQRRQNACLRCQLGNLFLPPHIMCKLIHVINWTPPKYNFATLEFLSYSSRQIILLPHKLHAWNTCHNDFFAIFPIRARISDVVCLRVCQMERLGFIFPATLYHCAGSQTHVTSGSRLARSTHYATTPRQQVHQWWSKWFSAVPIFQRRSSKNGR